VYTNFKVHFRDVVINLTKIAIQKQTTQISDFDNIGEGQEKRLYKQWCKKHKVLKKSELIKDVDTGIYYAGEFIVNIARNSILKKIKKRKEEITEHF
jgi:hypothetical protein